MRDVPELLAPAGSLDAVRAAVANGADAIYLGADRFNARDDGAQLTLEEVGEACRLAHEHGARIYLTFNILLKPAELPEALAHLGQCVDLGIDAAIVQDLGAVRLIRAIYPGLEVHGSTQMTVHDPAGARVMQHLGVSRVVLARENTLEDIATIHAAVPALGLESFVHGALCIAYSGQCFMSGMISERSANRGSCAQSCRKEYLLADARTGEELDRGYLISAKDLAAHDHLEAIARAGVGCLKVEGRKKKPEFVATVTRTYRGFLDRLAGGAWSPPTLAETEPLVQIFSRGNTGGMYGGRVGREYITRDHPDNRGLVLGTVIGTEGRELLVRVRAPLVVGDGIGLEHPEGAARGSTGFGVTRVRDVRRPGREWVQALALPAGQGAVEPGWVVVRSSDAALLAGARASFAALRASAPAAKVPVDLVVRGAIGEPLQVEFQLGDWRILRASSIPLGAATQRPLDAARLREQLGRLGTSSFVLRHLACDELADGAFLPVSALNELRQAAVLELEQALAGRRDSASHNRSEQIARATASPPAVPPREPAPAAGRLVAEVWQLDDARAAADAGADEISLDLFLRHPTPPVRHVRDLAAELSGRGIPLRLRTPTIVRPGERRVVDKWLALGLPVVTGHLGLVAELAAGGGDVVADYAVNCFNAHTAAFLFELGARRIVLSVELTTAEMLQVTAPWHGAGFEVFAWGRPEGMTIEHCVLSAAFDREPTTCRDLCVQRHTHTQLTDPSGYVFPVATDSACRNRLLHSRPVDGIEYAATLWRHGLRSVRCVFNVPGDPVGEVTGAWREALDGLAAGRAPEVAAHRARLGLEYTRGHFARAV